MTDAEHIAYIAASVERDLAALPWRQALKFTTQYWPRQWKQEVLEYLTAETKKILFPEFEEV